LLGVESGWAIGRRFLGVERGNLEPGLGLGLGKGGVGGVVIVRDADDRMGGISVVRMGGGRGVIGVQCGLKWWFGI